MHSHLKLRWRGFTLIELLIVIAIIAILIGLAAATYVNAEKNTRDNGRKTDVDTIAAAVEAYYKANDAFPGLIGNETGSALSNAQQSWDTAWGGCMTYDASHASIAYYYHPTSSDPSAPTYDQPCGEQESTGNPNGRVAVTNLFNPTDYQPSTTWIPGLGPYLNPMPVEGQYNSGLADPTSPLDPGGVLTSGNLQDAGNTAMTLVYTHLIGGYAVMTRLENSNNDATANPTTFSPPNPQLPCSNSTGACGGPTPLQVQSNNIYMVIR